MPHHIKMLIRPFFKFGFGLLLLFVMVSSCVPTKRITYLQYQNDLKEDNPADTVLRTYNLKKGLYTLQPEDIISIRVASVTDDEYNFIKKYETDLGIIRKLDQYDTRGSSAGAGGNQSVNRNLFGGGGGGVGSETGPSSIMLDRMNSGFVLDLKGELDLPQIGTLALADLTIPEAEAKVKAALEGYYETPMVRIQLLNYHFTIIGEVENEGRYTSYDPQMNVFDAISIAGNLTEFADRSNIKIIRKTGAEAKVIYLDMLNEDLLAANNFYLHKDDLIIVPALEARTTNQYTLPNVSRVLGIVSAALSLTALIISLNNR